MAFAGGFGDNSHLDALLARLARPEAVLSPDPYVNTMDVKGLSLLTPAQKELDAALAKQGMHIDTRFMETCPSGPGGQWVVGASSWIECEKLMGMRWVTKEGTCYPEICGTALKDLSRETLLRIVFRKTELTKMLLKFENVGRMMERDAWLAKRIAALRVANPPVAIALPVALADNAGYEWQNIKGKSIPLFEKMTEEQRFAVSRTFDREMPPDMRNVPDAIVIRRQKTMHEGLKEAAKKAKEDNTKAQELREVKNAMAVARSGGIVTDEEAEELLNKAKACAAVSTSKAMGPEMRDACAALDDCDYADYGSGRGLCAPKRIVEASKKDGALRTSGDDALDAWWREYFAAQVAAKQDAVRKFAARLGDPPELMGSPATYPRY